jgi:transposase-like protein
MITSHCPHCDHDKAEFIQAVPDAGVNEYECGRCHKTFRIMTGPRRKSKFTQHNERLDKEMTMETKQKKAAPK